jgi:hypothetical protein
VRSAKRSRIAAAVIAWRQKGPLARNPSIRLPARIGTKRSENPRNDDTSGRRVLWTSSRHRSLYAERACSPPKSTSKLATFVSVDQSASQTLRSRSGMRQHGRCSLRRWLTTSPLVINACQRGGKRRSMRPAAANDAAITRARVAECFVRRPNALGRSAAGESAAIETVGKAQRPYHAATARASRSVRRSCSGCDGTSASPCQSPQATERRA